MSWQEVGAELEIVPPDHLVSERATIDLGRRRVELLLAELAPAVLVPGHGDVVDLAFLRTQLRQQREMAALCRQVLEAGLPAEDAVRLAPFPPATARTAIERVFVTAGLSS